MHFADAVSHQTRPLSLEEISLIKRLTRQYDLTQQAVIAHCLPPSRTVGQNFVSEIASRVRYGSDSDSDSDSDSASVPRLRRLFRCETYPLAYPTVAPVSAQPENLFLPGQS